MSIFDRTSLMESVNSLDIDVAPYTGEIEPTMESVIEMSAELTEGVYKLNTSLYIADLLLEQRMRAGEDVEALTEAAVGDFFKNMIERFKTMWSKIKAFFANIFKKIEMFISTGKHFIAKYEKGILAATRNKDVKWITYNERESVGISISFARDDEKDMGVIVKSVKVLSDFVKTNIDTIAKFDKANRDEFKVMLKIDEWERGVCQSATNNNAETFAEAKEYLTKQIKGKKTGVTNTLDARTVNTMLKQIKEYLGKGKEKVKGHAKRIDQVSGSTISQLKSLEQTVNKDKYKESKAMELVTKYCSEMSSTISFLQWASNKYTTAYANEYKHNMSVLKAFASANSKLITRESVEYSDSESASDSLLESIIDAF